MLTKAELPIMSLSSETTSSKIISPEKEVYTLEEAQKMLELFAEEDESNYQYQMPVKTGR